MASRIAISGASGFVGTALTMWFTAAGDEVVRLVRRPAEASDEITWVPGARVMHMPRLEGLDAMIHLCGAPIAEARWTKARKRVLRDSRCASTTHIVDCLETLDNRPGVFIQASATGWYGQPGDCTCTETSPPGGGFLGELAQAWEAAGADFDQLGRRCLLRLGAVLDPAGGMLAKVSPIFRRGLGGRLGNGKQWLPWITLHDVCRAVDYLVRTPSIRGPVNAVAPTPVRNAIFTQALAQALCRPAFLPAPAPVLRILLGQMADELLLGGQRALPAVLLDDGFSFDHPTIDVACEALMAR